MANERITDFFIGKLLTDAEIAFVPNGSDIKEVQDALKTASKKGTSNIGFPEFTSKINEFIIVIENKASEDKQAFYEDNEKKVLSKTVKAISGFAENGALHYAQQIIQKTTFKKVFAFGCSGDEKHHTIRPIFVDEKGYKILDTVDNFTNFTVENIDQYYEEQVLGKESKEELNLKHLLSAAKTLHEHLRNYGQLGEEEKSLVVSGILLALKDEGFNVRSLTGDKIRNDGEKIFQSIADYLERVKVSPSTKKEKILGQFRMLKDEEHLNEIDDRLTTEVKKDSYLYKTPLRFFTEYIRDNIFDAINHKTSEDILGHFYSEFISFSGGEGQALGIVLTPTHITELFCDLVDLKPTDVVLDPCCGTSSFLIAAMHRMTRDAKNKKEIANIKKEQLYGIEMRPKMFTIASANMILRGDGQSNLENKDFFKVSNKELREKHCTVGFMNPPYSQAKKSKDAPHLSEISFINHLLDSLEDGGRCVVIVPQSTMVANTKYDKNIKKQILEKHTLEGVITLNKDTFYGIGVNPCIAVFTAHKSHEENKRVKFVNFEDDGYIISKHVGLTATTRAISRKNDLLDAWKDKRDFESKFLVKTTIEAEDEWLHSFYYFNDEIPKDGDFEKTVGDYLTFEFSMIMQGRDYLFDNID